MRYHQVKGRCFIFQSIIWLWPRYIFYKHTDFNWSTVGYLGDIRACIKIYILTPPWLLAGLDRFKPHSKALEWSPQHGHQNSPFEFKQFCHKNFVFFVEQTPPSVVRCVCFCLVWAKIWPESTWCPSFCVSLQKRELEAEIGSTLKITQFQSG